MNSYDAINPRMVSVEYSVIQQNQKQKDGNEWNWFTPV